VPAAGSKGGCASFSIKLPIVRPVWRLRGSALIVFNRPEAPQAAAARHRPKTSRRESARMVA